MLYAHSHLELPEDNWQTLEEHQKGVAELARTAAVFGTPDTAALLGLIHDTGKRSASFQARNPMTQAILPVAPHAGAWIETSSMRRRLSYGLENK